MDQRLIFFTILGMALVTYIPRLFPLLMLSSMSLPPVAIAWLRYVPVAVLAAMLFPSILVNDGQINLVNNNLFLLAALPTLIVAWKTRSLFGSVVIGMALVAAGRYILGL